MTAVYILCAIVIVMLAALIFLTVKKGKKDDVEGQIDQTQIERLKSDIQTTVKMENAMLTGVVKAQTDATKESTQRFDRFMEAVDSKLDKMRDETTKSLTEIRNDNVRTLADVKNDNAEQLEKMRLTVDEKLSSTLNKRFGESFKIVNDRLEEINRTFSELQNLQTGVNDLNKIFKNVKTRGTWGEVALESLLAQVLTEDQYERQYSLSRSESGIVDIVIKLPGKGDGEVLLPVDAKFPMEDYQRLVEASDNADVEGVEASGKALERRIKQEAMSIRDKYIKPPKTTDFAIMYLPVEGLYAEVVKRHGLLEELQNKSRVVVCGPTTLAALLNSLQMGFKSVAIEKRSTEIAKLLTAFAMDFDKFCVLLRKTGQNLERVQSSIAKAEDRTVLIRKKLSKVSKITGEEIEQGNMELLEEASADEIDFDNEEDIDED